MRAIKFLSIALLAILLSSCYHAQIITDAQPSGQVIDEPWAHGFIFGLVAPDEIRTASECPNGVAKVETQISFLNGLVSAITFNIYTPMHITVTCAAGTETSALNTGTEEVIPVSKQMGNAEVTEKIEGAVQKSLEFQKPVYLIFE